ncbi:THAP domain-containing protein 5 [Ixodes scapularis]
MPAMMPRLKPDAVPTLFGICQAPSTIPRDEERRETDKRPPSMASKYLQVALKPWSREAKVQTVPGGGIHIATQTTCSMANPVCTSSRTRATAKLCWCSGQHNRPVRKPHLWPTSSLVCLKSIPPRDPARREAWKRSVGRAGWTPSDGSVLCSDHFTADSVDCQKFRSAFGMPAMMPRLKPDAVPTLFGICQAPSTILRDEERRETDQRPPSTASKYLQVALKPWSREAKVQTVPGGGIHIATQTTCSMANPVCTSSRTRHTPVCSARHTLVDTDERATVDKADAPYVFPVGDESTDTIAQCESLISGRPRASSASKAFLPGYCGILGALWAGYPHYPMQLLHMSRKLINI